MIKKHFYYPIIDKRLADVRVPKSKDNIIRQYFGFDVSFVLCQEKGVVNRRINELIPL